LRPAGDGGEAARQGSSAGPLPLRLVAPGRFVAEVSISEPGSYRLDVGRTGTIPGTTFDFRIKGPASRQ